MILGKTLTFCSKNSYGNREERDLNLLKIHNISNGLRVLYLELCNRLRIEFNSISAEPNVDLIELQAA